MATIGPRFPKNPAKNKKKTRKNMVMAPIKALPTTLEDSAIVVALVKVPNHQNIPDKRAAEGPVISPITSPGVVQIRCSWWYRRTLFLSLNLVNQLLIISAKGRKQPFALQSCWWPLPRGKRNWFSVGIGGRGEMTYLAIVEPVVNLMAPSGFTLQNGMEMGAPLSTEFAGTRPWPGPPSGSTES